MDHFCFTKTIDFDKMTRSKGNQENSSLDVTITPLDQKVSNEKKITSSEKPPSQRNQGAKEIKRSVSNSSTRKQNCGGI